ncbi:MAG: 5-oxoprolinase subunit PxpA [Gammaproteobacteria bacterium]|nr:5-oxoprolinase subunit PxpA [Gammaproteobacteria bacterium]
MTTIDLNADLGEGDAYDAELLQVVSSCNIACGGHAGDTASIAATMREAMANGVSVGAHPSYPDREGFGRRSRFIAGEPLREALRTQLERFGEVADELGATITHVKPHGALYTDAVVDPKLADVIASAVADLPGKPLLVGQADTELETAARAHGLGFVAEAFVDRAYQPNGQLVPRSEPGAVHGDVSSIQHQAVRLARDGEVTARDGSTVSVRADTLCIHGDTPGAAAAARAVREALEKEGVDIRGVDG